MATWRATLKPRDPSAGIYLRRYSAGDFSMDAGETRIVGDVDKSYLETITNGGTLNVPAFTFELEDAGADLSPIVDAQPGNAAAKVTFSDPDGNYTDEAETVSEAIEDLDGEIAAVDVLTTKGDLAGFGTEPTRIPVGTDGQVLTADSASDEGVKWATPSGGGGAELQEITFSQALPTEGGEVDLNVDLGTSDALIVYMDVVRSAGTSTSATVSVYTDDTFSGSSTELFSDGGGFDPSTKQYGPQVGMGGMGTIPAALPYHDDDGSDELHVKLGNSAGGEACTLDITVRYLDTSSPA